MPTARLAARVFVGLAVGSIVGTTALLIAGPEHAWWLAHVLYWPYPIFLLAALAGIWASRRLPWRWRAFAFGALALVPGVIMDPALGGGERGGGRVRMMTFNAKDYLTLDSSGGLLDIAAQVARHDPDVVLLQDAHQLATMETHARHAVFPGLQVWSHGEYVLASRFGLRDCRARDMSYGAHERKYIRCVLSAHGIDVDLFVVHFETPRRGLDPRRSAGAAGWRVNVEARMTQARAVARDVRASVGPVIVAGDLNAPARSLVVRELLDAGLRDAHALAGRGFGYTYGHGSVLGFSFLRIDHVLASPAVAVLGSRVSDDGRSPHRAVIVDLALHRAD